MQKKIKRKKKSDQLQKLNKIIIKNLMINYNNK